jgi:hypothetical protein
VTSKRPKLKKTEALKSFVNLLLAAKTWAKLDLAQPKESGT